MRVCARSTNHDIHDLYDDDLYDNNHPSDNNDHECGCDDYRGWLDNDGHQYNNDYRASRYDDEHGGDSASGGCTNARLRPCLFGG